MGFPSARNGRNKPGIQHRHPRLRRRLISSSLRWSVSASSWWPWACRLHFELGLRMGRILDLRPWKHLLQLEQQSRPSRQAFEASCGFRRNLYSLQNLPRKPPELTPDCASRPACPDASLPASLGLRRLRKPRSAQPRKPRSARSTWLLSWLLRPTYSIVCPKTLF